MATLPDKIGKYRIDSLVAKGGMGSVFLAEHPDLKRKVVIKKLSLRGDSAATERFKREAKILLDLQNPNVVHLHDYFREGSSQYLVLEYVDGMSLDTLVRKKKSFSGVMALLVVYEVCLGLKYAHDRGIVHRDIKPGNILISKRGEIKLADFGIAASEYSQGEDDLDRPAVERERAAGQRELTMAGSMLGTPSYMPPEQFADSSSVDKRADIYAVGVMLYEMVTGVKPFPGGFNPQTVELIRRGKYLPPERLDPGIPAIVRRIIKKTIRPKAKDRYQDLAPVLKDIRRYLKRYPIRLVREVMVRNMVTNAPDVTEPPFLPKKRTALRVALAALALVLSASLAVAAWKSGLVYRTLLRRWFTPVEVVMSVPASLMDTADMQFRSFVFIDDGDKIPEVAGTRRTLGDPASRPLARALSLLTARTAQKPASASRAKLDLASAPVWLRPGPYRAKVVAGSRVWWQTFSVGAEAVTLKPDFGGTDSRPLRVVARVFDRSSGRDISALSKLYVRLGSSWEPLTRETAERLRSGTIVRVKAEAKGYEESVFSLKIEWFQDELFLTASLAPEQRK